MNLLRKLFKRTPTRPDRAAWIADTTNDSWALFRQSQQISLLRRPLFNRQDEFFTIGSCFAEEIRKALTARGIRCLPDYRNIAFDPARVRIDTLPKREHMNYYNTFSIRQEIERAAGLWRQEDSDLWEVDRRALAKNAIGTGVAYQDPYRRRTFGASPPDLLPAIAAINTVMTEGMKTATAIVMTLGLTEVFVKRDNGLVANQVPGYGRGSGESETTFHASTFAENLDNVERSVRLLRKINPTVKIVITVSPVPLAKTFSGQDIFVANMRSKSILVAVAQEICGRWKDCYYFPSYEIVSSIGKNAFIKRDARHVRTEVVDAVIETFVEATFRERPSGNQPAAEKASSYATEQPAR